MSDVIKTVSPDNEIESMLTNQIRSLKGETVMTLYIGVDFHPHQQTVAWCDTETGETRTFDLAHDLEEVRKFYSLLPEPAIIGIEASSRAAWFENMLFETGHKLFVGNPVLIRKRATSRHKNDRRDAELILELLLRGEFPSLWRRPPESDRILEMLRLRSSLVRQRTRLQPPAGSGPQCRAAERAHENSGVSGCDQSSRPRRDRRSQADAFVQTGGELQ